MKFKQIRKVGAVLLAAAVVCGALPVSVGGTPLFDTAITAEAADAGEQLVTPTVGVTYKWGTYGYGANFLTTDGTENGEYYFSTENGTAQCADMSPALLHYSRYSAAKDEVKVLLEWTSGSIEFNFQIDDNRYLERPAGVKIVSGTGKQSDPFIFELAYDREPTAFETVTVGKKWYVGDLINTDAYFKYTYDYDDSGVRLTDTATGRLLKQTLSPPQTYYIHMVSYDPTSVQKYSTTFRNMTVEGYYYDQYNIYEGTHSVWDNYISFLNDSDPGDVIGIKVTGGSGTKEDPFTIALIGSNEPDNEIESAKMQIEALPNTITAADKDAIEAARAAYNTLTDEQKAYVGAETLAKLTAAETLLPFAMSDQPQDFTGTVGDAAAFTVDTAAGVSYQWQFETASGWQNSNMTGAKTNTLSVPITAERENQQYRCVVSINGKTAYSQAAAIRIKPMIMELPKDYSGAVGETAKFTVTATGTNLSYQWQFLDNGFWKSSGMTGAKTASLSVPITAARNGQQYRCIVSFDGTSIFTNAAKIIVKENPITISAQPKDYTGAVGETAKFTVNASGTNLTYQWQFKSTSGWQNSGMTGSKTNTLSVPVTEVRNGQQYRCVISSNGTSVNSNPAKIIVKANAVTISAQPKSYTGNVGDTAKFTVAASGTNLSYQWQYLDKADNKWKNSGLTGALTNTLTVPVTAARDGLQFHCIVKSANGASVTSGTAQLTVKPAITANPKNYEGKVGDTAKFTVTASGTNLTYQWQFLDNGAWKNSGMTGAKTSTLSVPVTAARDGQKYRCVVTAGNGSSSESAAAAVLVKPVITANPSNFTGKVGDTAKFTVTASGTGLTYQWQFYDNGVWKDSGMTGAKTATISVPVTAARNGQQYRCVVKAANGATAASAAAKLTVKS